MKKFNLISILIIFLFTVGLSGCFDFIEDLDLDPTVVRANPYIKKIVFNDINLRAHANSIISDCESNDIECQINSIYRHIVENYNYLSDPVGTELIQSPEETIQIGGGDCEDLTILYMSLLENIGIKTYLVLNETHAYSLVYDVNIDNLWNYIEQSFIKLVEEEYGEEITDIYEQSFILKGKQYWYYGGNGTNVEVYGSDYLNITYDIKSTRALDFYVVPSKEDFNKFVDGEEFMNYPNCKNEKILSISGICSNLKNYGGVIIRNNNRFNANVDVKLEFYLHPSFYNSFENNTVTYYHIDGKKCIVVDCTAGKWGYPGYDGGVEGKKIAIDPVSKDYTILD
jgi:hypothetical protein